MPYGTDRPTEGAVLAVGNMIYWYDPTDRKLRPVVERPYRVDYIEFGRYGQPGYPFVVDAYTVEELDEDETSATINVTLCGQGAAPSTMNVDREVYSLCYAGQKFGGGGGDWEWPHHPFDTLLLACGRPDAQWQSLTGSYRRDFPGNTGLEPSAVICHRHFDHDVFWLSGSTLHCDMRSAGTVYSYKANRAILVPVWENKEAVHVLHYGEPAQYLTGARLSHRGHTLLTYPCKEFGVPCLAVIYLKEGEDRLLLGTRGYRQNEPWFRLYDEPIRPDIRGAEPVLEIEKSTSDADFPPNWANPCRAVGLKTLRELVG